MIDAGPPDAPPPDAATTAGFFLDDNVGDFTGTLDGAVIEPWGAVAPRAYYTGALRARASDDGVFSAPASTTWAQVEATLATGKVAPMRRLTTAWGPGTPAGLGLTAGDTFTVAGDGEIYLTTGTWTFYVLADDCGFLELAPPNTATFTRVVSATWPTEASGMFTAATDGWYPIRVAYSENVGDSQLAVDASGPGLARAPISRQRLRFAASGMTGLAATGFTDAHLLGDAQSTLDATAPAGIDWMTGAPGDLGITNVDGFSTRWAGQLRVDTAGDYTFRYVTDDGQRLWIDGALVQDLYDDTTHDTMTSAMTLATGWHALVVDQSEAGGGAQAKLGIAAGPALVGATLPIDHLRPVEARAERFETGTDRTDRPIPDNGQVESAIAIDAPIGAKTRGVEVAWTFDHPYRGDLAITLIAPDGSSALVRDHVGGATSGTVTEHVHLASLDDTTASGTWRLRVQDTVSLDTGTLRDFELTVHHHAGEAPIAPFASYLSPVKDLGMHVTAYRAFSWQASLGAGSALRAYVRSGDTPAAIAAAAWSSPLVDPGAGTPPVPATRYFQYRLDFTSDGDGAATVDWVRLDHQEVVQ